MPTTLTAPKSCDAKYAGKTAWHPEAASQTFKKGDWVYLVAGKLTICAAAGNDVGNISILGRAGADATGTTDTMLPVELATDETEYCFPIYHSTAASAVTAVTDVGTTLPLRNQGGVWCLNKENDGTNDRFIIKTIDKRYPTGEQYGFVWANLLAANRQVG